MSPNECALPTSPSPKAKAEPYIALMLGSGETGPAGLGLGDVAHSPQTPAYAPSAVMLG